MSRALTVRHGKSFKADGLQPQPELQDRSRFFNNGGFKFEAQRLVIL